MKHKSNKVTKQCQVLLYNAIEVKIMAKYEKRLAVQFDDFLDYLHKQILASSISATLEDGSDYNFGEVACSVRVYERYSIIGSNRLSLSITLFGKDGDVFLTAITAGGSQAVLFKINTFGEENFLSELKSIVKRYEAKH